MAQFKGTIGADVFTGTGGSDNMIGAGGDDVFRNVGGWDSIQGNSGSDTFFVTDDQFDHANPYRANTITVDGGYGLDDGSPDGGTDVLDISALIDNGWTFLRGTLNGEATTAPADYDNLSADENHGSLVFEKFGNTFTVNFLQIGQIQGFQPPAEPQPLGLVADSLTVSEDGPAGTIDLSINDTGLPAGVQFRLTDTSDLPGGDISLDRDGVLRFDADGDFQALNIRESASFQVTYEAFIPGSAGGADNPITVEAEDLQTNSSRWSASHGDRLYSSTAKFFSQPLTATLESFSGDSGAYAVSVFAHDSAHGVENYELLINGQVAASFATDTGADGAGWYRGTFTEFQLPDIQINQGDEVSLKLVGASGALGFAQVDKLVFTSTGLAQDDVIGEATVSITVEGEIEAEDMAEREGRLMEATDDFFDLVKVFEDDFARSEADFDYPSVVYNALAQLTGTNSDDQITDTQADSDIFAMGGNDDIDGGAGKDRIYAGKGNDIVRGGEGQDLLDGGEGYDILIGGAGIDIFVFRKGEGTTVIEDFQLSYDVLDVEGFENLTYPALTAAGAQVGDDVVYNIGDDTLVLRNADLATMVELDLCMR